MRTRREKIIRWKKKAEIRLRRTSLFFEKLFQSKWGFWGSRISLLVALLFLLNLFTPIPGEEEVALKEGEIAPEDLIAPFTFYITKSPGELEAEQEAASRDVLPVFDLDEEKEGKILERVEQFFQDVEKIGKGKEIMEVKIQRVQSNLNDLSASTITELLTEPYQRERKKGLSHALQSLLKEVLEKGVMRDKKAFKQARGVEVRKEEGSFSLGLRDILDLSESSLKIREGATRFFPGNFERMDGLVELASAFLEENLLYNDAETRKKQTQEREKVSKIKGVVKHGEMIIRSHDPVTREVVNKLRSLRDAKGNGNPEPVKFASHIGRNGFFLLLLMFFALFLRRAKPEEWNKYSTLLLLSLIISGVMGLSSLVLLSSQNLLFSPLGISQEAYLYLFPVPFASTLVAILLGQEISVALTVLLSLLLGLYTDLRFTGSLVALAGGLAGAASVKGIVHRYQFYRTLLFIILAQITTILSLDLMRMKVPEISMNDYLFGSLNGIVSTFLTIMLLPLFERLFKITTNITLLELSDMNRPLLRELAVKAPGTFHHSLVLGSLSEAAAKAIGANPLLARVSAYYHDIGKMKKPQYFIENQSGIKNPHDGLTPEMSSLVVFSHIKEGVEMARDAGLPQRIIEVIREHQGTALMRYFYEKAKMRNMGKGIEESHFRYPGPKPSSSESAIIMLADTLEATCRSLENPTPTRLKEAIQETLERRLQDGQLDSSDLTLRDLRKIGEAFFPVLVGIFHPRIEYPSETNSPTPLREERRYAKSRDLLGSKDL